MANLKKQPFLVIPLGQLTRRILLKSAFSLLWITANLSTLTNTVLTIWKQSLGSSDFGKVFIHLMAANFTGRVWKLISPGKQDWKLIIFSAYWTFKWLQAGRNVASSGKFYQLPPDKENTELITHLQKKTRWRWRGCLFHLWDEEKHLWFLYRRITFSIEGTL